MEGTRIGEQTRVARRRLCQLVGSSGSDAQTVPPEGRTGDSKHASKPPPPRLARTGTRVAESMLDIEPTAELNQSVIRSVDDLEPDEEAEFSQMHENA
jgi:hypothetical protein